MQWLQAWFYYSNTVCHIPERPAVLLKDNHQHQEVVCKGQTRLPAAVMLCDRGLYCLRLQLAWIEDASYVREVPLWGSLVHSILLIRTALSHFLHAPLLRSASFLAILSEPPPTDRCGDRHPARTQSRHFCRVHLMQEPQGAFAKHSCVVDLFLVLSGCVKPS